VDDDAAVRDSLQRVLLKEKINVVAAASGEEALRAMEAREPDLMITDLRLGSPDGWELLSREQRLHPGLPVIVISALSARDSRGANRLAKEFFQKPLDPEALLAAIRRLLNQPDPSQPQS